jgi:hypothetical protein
MLYVEKSTPADAFDLSFKLRQLDKFEVAAMGHSPLDVLIAPFRYTRKGVNTYSVFYNDSVIAMFGVISTPQNIKHGVVWMLASDELNDHWLYFTKRTKNWVNYFLADYDYVHNYVSLEQEINIKWLKWLGFSFKKEEMLVKGTKVLYFYRKIQGVSKCIQPIIGDIGPKWTTDLS